MNWTRTETLALATHSCVQCNGLGLKSGEADDSAALPCNCVLRNVFRVCHARFRECSAKDKRYSRVSLEAVQGRDHKGTWSLKDEEYIADFCKVSERILDDFEHRLFRYHFLLGADWKLCTRKLGMDRGNFFHAVYRIEQKLGRVFRELEPYPLFPLDEYFHGPSRMAPALIAIRPLQVVRPEHLQFPRPLRKTA